MSYDDLGGSPRRDEHSPQSRAGMIRPARRKAAKARLSISGAAGSGKTWVALSVAEVLAPDGPVLMIDTEPSDPGQSAGELYAHRFDFDVLPWALGQGRYRFDPRDLAATMNEVGPHYADGVIIVDSASHFWRGPGGTLELSEGRFGGWKEARPAHNALVESMLRSPAHVVMCMRAKMDHLVEEKPNGRGGTKQVVTKLGMAPIQSDDLEYEMQVAVYLDQAHTIEISKSRADVLAGRSWPAGAQAEFAAEYRDWLGKGLVLVRQADLDVIAQVCNAPKDAAGAAVRRDFRSEFGRELEEDRLPEIWTWLSSRVAVPFHGVDAMQDDTGRTVCSTCWLPIRAGWHIGRGGTPRRIAQEPTEPSGGTDIAPEPPQAATDDPGASGGDQDDDDRYGQGVPSPEPVGDPVETLRDRVAEIEGKQRRVRR